ncbi:MAG: SIR2 family protein [Bacteroidota bacterium]
MADQLPEPLIDRVREGQLVLFLGAGASLSAVDKNGNHPPDAKKLARLIDEKFLGGAFLGFDLQRTAELAISETDLRTVQEFIRDALSPFEPSEAHKILPKFAWKGIVTTNHDRLIERAYTAVDGVQDVAPILTDQDPVEEILRNETTILLLKLHGCVSRTSDEKCPFILSPDQYATHLKGREILFRRLEEWGRERSILFIGHSLADPDIRAVLLRLTSRADFQPRYYLVCPKISEPEKRFWGTKKVTAISMSFEEAMESIDSMIPEPARKLVSLRPAGELPIQERFAVSDPHLSYACQQFLTIDVDYVRAVQSTELLNPRMFYRGLNKGWSAIEQELDVRRTIADPILLDLIGASSTASTAPQFLLIKGHAGSGKTVLLRRLSWDAAKQLDLLCVYLRPSGKINTESIRELLSVTNEMVYFFIDRIATRVSELKDLLENIGELGRRLVVIGAERVNEWNVDCNSLSPFVTDEKLLKYLNENEINMLLKLLEEHDSLGMLSGATMEDRIAAFKERAGRQLLVALHEATLGKQFEEIIEDEYRNIKPLEARLMYLTICVLNRYDEPVRAGIISRVHNVPFERFRSEFLGPLEQVVIVSENKYIRDFQYRARHPHIADIVFHRVLANQDERFEVLYRAFDGLDLGYSSDSKVFWEIVKAKNLMDMFSNHDLIRRLFDLAGSIALDDPHLYHQQAIYEMRRPSGNMKVCDELLRKAEGLAPLDRTIKHSRSEFYLKMAENSKTELEKTKYFEEASLIARGLSRFDSEKPYAFSTLLKSIRSQLETLLSKEPLSESSITKIVQEFEQSYVDAIQRYPNDPYLLDEESKVASLLGKSDKALAALRKAFERNPRSSYIGLRLFWGLWEGGNVPDARTVITQAIEANPGERRLNYAYSKLLLAEDPENLDAILYHAKRSFVPGDKNYDAQLIYARALFLKNDMVEFRKTIDTLRRAYVDYEVKKSYRYPTSRVFSGAVAKLEASYGFVALDGTGDWVHLSKEKVDPELWPNLNYGSRVNLRIAFTFFGVSATDVELS